MSIFINFLPGKLYWNYFSPDESLSCITEDITFTEDMLYVQYHNHLTLRVHWYKINNRDNFVIRIMQERTPSCWKNPLFKRRCSTILELIQLLQQCVQELTLLLKQGFFGDIDFYLGELWGSDFSLGKISSHDTYASKKNDISEIVFRHARPVVFSGLAIQIKWHQKTGAFTVIILQENSFSGKKKSLQRLTGTTIGEIKMLLKQQISSVQAMLRPSVQYDY